MFLILDGVPRRGAEDVSGDGADWDDDDRKAPRHDCRLHGPEGALAEIGVAIPKRADRGRGGGMTSPSST